MLRRVIWIALLLLISGCGASSDVARPEADPAARADGSMTIAAGPPSKAIQAVFDRARANRRIPPIAIPVDAYEPEVAGPAGRRAFDDLGSYYRHGRQPPTDDALRDLDAPDAARRAAAGKYIHAIFVQSRADTTNGRGSSQREIAWGGGTRSDANELRNKLAERFGQAAETPAAVDAALWLVEQDPRAQNQAHGATALCRIRVVKSEAIFRDLLARPHPNRDVLLHVIKEVEERRYRGLAADIAQLVTHYRASIRTAARQAATTLELDDLASYQAEQAFTPWLDEQLRNVLTMVEAEVPDDAVWGEIAVTHPPYRTGENPSVSTHWGWVLETSDAEYRVLTQFGQERRVDRKQTSFLPSTLVALAQELLAVRQGTGQEAMERLSGGGSFTGQFEAGFIGLPEGLASAWLYQRGDRATAAKLLFPRIEAADDDRWVFEVLRDLLGDMYHRQMLVEFSYHRDYDRTAELAGHLSKSVFAGYRYQRRVQQLAEQLAARGDDFQTFCLPRPQEWSELKNGLSRVEQIDYLTKRLRLLNCIQRGQPGDVSYRSPQFSDPELPARGDAEPTAVINPYVELLAMQLGVAELPALVPLLADQQFMPTFSYWRDFHPSRTLHRVNWVVEKVINASAQRKLVQIDRYEGLNEPGRSEYLDRIVQWCGQNGHKSRKELLVEVLDGTYDFGEFRRAAGECAKLKMTHVAPQAAARFGDFPRRNDDVAELCYRFETAEVVSEAGKWIANEDEGVRFWAALILLRHGEQDQGFTTLRGVLAEDDGSHWYPRAIEPLLQCGGEGALNLACGIMATDRFRVGGYEESQILQRLFLAGRRECLEYLLDKIDSRQAAGSTARVVDGKVVPRTILEEEFTVEMLAEWHPRIEHTAAANSAVRNQWRNELKPWLKAEFEKIQAGDPPAMNVLGGRLQFSEWQIVAP